MEIFDENKLYTDQTGSFPVTSRKGAKYICIAYEYDSNAILAKPMKGRKGRNILAAYKELLKYLEMREFRPKTHWLDNKASTALKYFNRSERITIQLSPPGIHQHNAAERAIRTFKNHFIAGLCSTDNIFPLHLWDCLIEQAIMTLNMLQPARRNPKMSAYTMLEGQFDVN